MMNRPSVCRTALIIFGLATALSYGVDRICAEEKAPPRAEKPNFKGTELYCSYDKKAKKWSFALLPGTNRLKTAKEVKAALTITGIDRLKTELAKLAEGDSVFCHGPAFSARHGLDAKTFKDLVAFCKSKKIAFR